MVHPCLLGVQVHPTERLKVKRKETSSHFGEIKQPNPKVRPREGVAVPGLQCWPSIWEASNSIPTITKEENEPKTNKKVQSRYYTNLTKSKYQQRKTAVNQGSSLHASLKPGLYLAKYSDCDINNALYSCTTFHPSTSKSLKKHEHQSHPLPSWKISLSFQKS